MSIAYLLKNKGARKIKRSVCIGCNVLVVLLTTIIIPATASANEISSPDTEGNVGRFTSLVMNGKGNPVISYHDQTNRDLKMLWCDDPNCAGDQAANVYTIDSERFVGTYTSTSSKITGESVVTYYDAFKGALKLIRCKNANCAGNSAVVTHSDEILGMYSSLVLDDSGNPVVSFYDDTNGDLKLLRCHDSSCKEGESQSVSIPDSQGDVGLYTSLVLDSYGNPVISYYASGKGLKLLHCYDRDCKNTESSTISIPDHGDVGWYSSLKLDSNGNPVVSYFDFATSRLKVLHCDDPACAGDESKNITVPDVSSNVGAYLSMVLDGKGNPVISYYDSSAGDLKILHCDDPNCAGDEMGNIMRPDSQGDVGLYTSLVLDSEGNPVVSYYDHTNGDLKILHCSNPNCSTSE